MFENEAEKAWYDYCITNHLIAYGEVPELTEEQIEAYCREQYEKDCEKIRRTKWQSRQGQDVVVSAASGTTGITVRIAGGLNDSKRVDTEKSLY